MPDSQEQNIKDILEIVSFIKDNAATKEALFGVKEDVAVLKEDLSFVKEDVAVVKEDLSIFKDEIMTNLERFATKEDSAAEKDEILTHLDSFAVLNQKLNTELTALRSKYDRLEFTVKKVLEHLNLNFKI